jgi:signal transduction histidine kinase
MKPLSLWAATLLLVAGQAFGAGTAAELGHPIVQNYTPRDYQGHPLCQAVIQGADGILYFANNTDAVAFDGVAWRMIKLPAESSGIRRFALAGDGTVYLGGGGVIGCFRGAPGRAEFVSLAGHLPAADRHFSDFFDVVALGDAVYFSTEGKILVWRSGRFATLPLTADQRPSLHVVAGTVYLTTRDHPLCRIAGDRVEVVADDPCFRDNSIALLEAAADGGLQGLTATRGFFHWSGGRATPAPTDLDRWLDGRRIYGALRLPGGSLAVAFSASTGNGGMLFDAAGRLLWRLDESIGLPNPAIRDFATDREGGLWLGLESGLTRIEWAAGVTLFDAINGLGHAFVVDTVVHEGVRFTATIDGVYRLHPADGTGTAARYERIFNLPVYSLLTHPGGLLARGYNEIFLLTPAGFTAVAKSPNGMGALGTSLLDAARVWFTSTRGLHSLYRTAAGWRDEGAVAGFDEYANGQIPDPDGNLLVTTHSRGTFRIEFDGQHGAERGTPRILRYDAKARRFVERDPARSLPSDVSHDYRTPNQDIPGFRWKITNSPSSAQRAIALETPDSKKPGPLPHLVVETSGMLHRLREETSPDGTILWACGANGLVRVELDRLPRTRPPLGVLLRATGLKEAAPQTAGGGSLEFEFAAPRFQAGAGVEYQTRLSGYGDDWSPWSADRKRTFTHLPSGDYRFEVRAREIDGTISPIASRAFSILPPWWQTGWFLGLAGLAGVGAIAGATRWFATRALKRRVALLEAQSAVERERLRLARDLHDEVGSGLGRVILFAGEADRIKDDPAQLAVALQRVRTTAQDLVQHAREIVWAVSPQHDTLASLIERLGDYTVDTLRAAGIACTLDVPAAAEIPAVAIGSEMRHSLFLAVKEAVHNCVKYSGARDATLTLRLDGGFLEIALQDHGRGFFAGERQGSGHGLRNLTLRAEALGGSGSITSKPGHGTTVRLHVPVSPSNPSPP